MPHSAKSSIIWCSYELADEEDDDDDVVLLQCPPISYISSAVDLFSIRSLPFFPPMIPTCSLPFTSWKYLVIFMADTASHFRLLI
jgi:hypothetical protein